MRLSLFSKGLAIAALVGTALLGQPGWAQAQNEAGAAAPAGGGRGGGMRWNPEEMRQRFMDRIKEDLAPTTEEWQAIEPLLTGVMEKQRQLRSAQMGGMFGGRGGRGGNNRGGDQTPAEIQSLREALDKKDTPAPEIQAKLKALRDLRKTQDAELQKAREELRKVLSVRQEAQLVLSGILD